MLSDMVTSNHKTHKPIKVAFCTTCMGRAEHIKRTLATNIADNADFPNVVFVLLDYNSQDGLGEYIRETFPEELESGRLVYYHNPCPKNFRMAHAKNQAARLGIVEGGDILVNIDADNWTGYGFARYVAGRFEIAAEDGEVAFMRARENHFGPGADTSKRMGWGCAGRIAVTKEAFLNAGGYDEHFKHWGPDDKDFTARLIRLGYTRVGIRRRHMKSITHSDDLRFVSDEADAPKSMEDSVEMFKLEGRDEITVVNYGSVGVGTVFRNFDISKPIVIDKIPTRVFGIGVHKTATTSLAVALAILGYDSAHWESPHWARNIWNEMKSVGRSKTLEAHYALSNFPFPALYQEIDKAYPGSKFILTIRDEAKWVKSVERHWNRYKTREWDNDAFSNEMHTHFYGSSDFNPELMLNRYHQHNADVLEYFKDRPKDLLIMHMESETPWPPLCSFLDKPVPETTYPMEFQTPASVPTSIQPTFNQSYPG